MPFLNFYLCSRLTIAPIWTHTGNQSKQDSSYKVWASNWRFNGRNSGLIVPIVVQAHCHLFLWYLKENKYSHRERRDAISCFMTSVNWYKVKFSHHVNVHWKVSVTLYLWLVRDNLRTEPQRREKTKHRTLSWEDSDLWSTLAAQWWLTLLTSEGGDGPVRGEQRTDTGWQRQNVLLTLLSSCTHNVSSFPSIMVIWQWPLNTHTYLRMHIHIHTDTHRH